ncbi:piggyBac transposable element-derived protein 4-like [Oscarella lobularis]|uniref:piggyBac transposable element-derived protein 4-like n=1 Tax=Oscarella lobularis TaxID=121494 RepID=UPI0033141152
MATRRSCRARKARQDPFFVSFDDSDDEEDHTDAIVQEYANQPVDSSSGSESDNEDFEEDVIEENPPSPMEIEDEIGSEEDEEADSHTSDIDYTKLFTPEWSDAFLHYPLMEFEDESGPNVAIPNDANALTYFQLYWSDDVIDLLVKNTNAYAEHIRGPNPSSSCREWYPTTRPEMKAFLGVTLLMGLLKLPRLEDYWQKSFPYLKTQIPVVFSKTRYEQLKRFLHVSDIAADLQATASTAPRDKLMKVRPLIKHCLEKFKSSFKLAKNITVDEAMIPYKGRWSIKQYMKDKPTKWGIKVYVLADALTGYIWNFFIYVGKAAAQGVEPVEGLCSRAVLDLVDDCHYKGHVLFVDNYYTSPYLFEKLFYYDIYATGTARVNRSGYPKSLKKQLPKKPARGYYKHYMRGVDRGDQLLALYGSGRKSKKAWKRIFFYLLESSILNAYILEGFKSDRHAVRGREKRDLKEFRSELASLLIDGFSSKGSRSEEATFDFLRLNCSLPHLPVPDNKGKKNDCKSWKNGYGSPWF